MYVFNQSKTCINLTHLSPTNILLRYLSATAVTNPPQKWHCSPRSQRYQRQYIYFSVLIFNLPKTCINLTYFSPTNVETCIQSTQTCIILTYLSPINKLLLYLSSPIFLSIQNMYQPEVFVFN